MAGEQHSMELTESMMRGIEDACNDSMFTGRPETRNETTPGTIIESASSIGTTPDPLNTAFVNTAEVTAANAKGSQISLSQPQQQSQTTKETSSNIQGLVSRILQQEEHPIIDLRTPTKTMVSTGTMPRTPSSAPTSSTTTNDINDLYLPSAPSIIDLRSPMVEIIDLSSSPDTPTKTDS